MFKAVKSNTSSAKSSTKSSPFHRESDQDAFIQPKLNIGKPNDRYEVEADSAADKVVNKTSFNNETSFFSPAPTFQKNNFQKKEKADRIQEKPIAQTITPLVQLQPSEEESIQEKPNDCIQKQEEEEDIQKNEDGKDENIQTKINVPNHPIRDISSRIQQANGNGIPLPNPILNQMQNGFGADFSGVRVHSDTSSVSMNRDLGARAFTNYNNIFFNEGEFQPNSTDGQTLLAHELTHTIQQGASTATQTPNLPVASTETLVENESQAPSTSSTTEIENNSLGLETTTTQSPIDIDSQDTNAITEEPLTDENLESTETVAGTENVERTESEEAEETFPTSAAEDPAFNALENRVERTAENQQATNPAEQETQAAQGAAAVPSNERMGSAQANQVAVMEEQEAGEFDAVAFKARLMERIASMQLPENQEEATEFEDNNNIQEISNAASQDASQAQQATAGAISEATSATPNVDAVPEREVTALPEPPIGQSPSSVHATSAMPTARPDGQVSQPLQDNMQEVDQEMIDNEVTEEQLANSNEPEFASALDSRSEARANTETAPGQFREQETQSLTNSQQRAENTSEGTLEGMHGDRGNILTEVQGQQVETGAQNTTERERISNEINVIYETTKTDVETILEDLDTKVSEKFDAAAVKAKQSFEDYVEREMDRYKDRRYSGLSGKAQWLVDKFAGLPDEVNQFFVDGRALYIAEMDTALTDISNYIGQRLTEAKNRIETGKQEVTDYVEALPENLQTIGKEASEDIQDKFDQLTDDVNSKQDELIDSLAQQYNDSLSEVDARIEEMKAANRGLIDMALDAIKGVIETIRKLKQLISDLLSEIQASLSIIMADPIKFVSNLFDGVKQGFNNFKENIEKHLIAGFLQWLTGALGPVGIIIPENLFSLKGIFSLVMQVLGLTWDYMRGKAVKLLGEPVVQAMEFGLEMFQIIREKGVEGIWEYIKEQFTDLKETIIDSIKDMLVVQVIQAGIKWLLSLLIPGAGFIKAIMAIKDFIVFFVESALMLIPTLIEAIRAMAAGSISLVAAAVEKGLAALIPLVIKLFAKIIGLGGLVAKVQKIIQKVRSRIDRAINKLILKAKKAFGKLVKKGKAAVAGLLDWLGFKKTFKTADNKDHELLVKGEDENVELWVKSTPKKVRDLLDNHPEKGSNAWKEAKKHYGDFYASAPKLAQLDKKYESATGSELNSLRGQIRSHIESVNVTVTKLADALKILGVEGQIDEAVKTNITPNTGSLLKFKKAKPLTALPGNTQGNSNAASAGDIPGWLYLKSVQNSGTDVNIFDKYVRFHIFHDQMHGPADNTNLVAATKDANNSYYQKMEVNVLRKLYTPGVIMFLEVTLNYHALPYSEFLEQATAKWGFMKLDESNNQPVVDDSREGGTITVRSNAPPDVSGVVTIKLHGKGADQLKGAPIFLPAIIARRLAAALKEYPHLPVLDAIENYYTIDRMFLGRKPFIEFKQTDKSAVNAAVRNNANIDLSPI